MSKSYAATVNQAIELLKDIEPHEYKQLLPPHFPSSIGAHIRHIVDHFWALIEGSSTGNIDYNARHRHSKLEYSPSAALAALIKISMWLNNLPLETLNIKVNVISEIDIDKRRSTICRSTLKRELVFVISHAIHHYALIKIMCTMQEKCVPTQFGVAPATITHLKKMA